MAVIVLGTIVVEAIVFGNTVVDVVVEVFITTVGAIKVDVEV